ncbi:ATP-grasp domain-containing protein [Patescibacteria group bacterium]|nr:ATP-grasp domain-containing protein [Patescibacteria group bacterium]
MSQTRTPKYVVYVGSISERSLENLETYIKQQNKNWHIMILQEETVAKTPYSVSLNFNSDDAIHNWVDIYGKDILCVTARGERNIPLLQRLIPFLPPHVLTPSVASLKKSTEKTEMRKAFRKYNPKITPRFKIIKDLETIDAGTIMVNMDFPVIVKPSGLASSLLVQAAHYPEELESILRKIKKKITSVYKNQKGRGVPSILVEEIIEGDIYSIDAYTDNQGVTFFTPFVKYKTSAQKGFDDFFLYERIIPARLSKEKRESGKQIAQEGIKALGLRNTTTHIELVYSEDGWKIIEIGPRIGGNREMMYELCFGLNHNINDLLIRIPKRKPVLKEKRVGYISTIQFFPRDEGYISKVEGLKRAKNLASFYELKQKLKKGDKSLHAKNGGTFVAQITLFNKHKAQFIEDKRKLEKMVHIETKKNGNKK